jgi:DNA repair exonuclease SbcCD ATPase subunit
MIPLSVRVHGWMRYRDEQLADFSGGSLIAIVGENGAGKSSIFDAITFALYGQHRLGKQHADQLISQDMDRLSVEFEFEAGGQRYLVRRSRGHKDAERDQSLWIWDRDASDWTQVPGTEKEDALRRTLEHVVRLSPEAFTSSFLLQQGAATDFLDADPKPRFDIISSLIGLKEYEALEKRARDGQRVEKTRLDDLTAKLKEFEGVDDDAIARLRDDVAATAGREAAATRALREAQALLADAQRYTRLAAEVAALDAQIAGAETLLAEKEQIEKDAELFETLDRAIGAVGRVAASLADAERATSAADAASKGAAAIDVDRLAADHEGAVKQAEAAEKHAKKAEREQAAAAKAEREAYDFAQLATAVLEGRSRGAGFDAQVKDLDAQLRKQSGACQAAGRDMAAAASALEQADAALDAARRDAAVASAGGEALEQQLSERKAAARESICARCGQPVDKKAAKQQIDELTARLEEAQRHATVAAAAEKVAVAARTAASKRHADLAASTAREERQLHRIDAQRGAAIAERERTVTLLAEHEAKLDGRLKDVASAGAAYEVAQTQLDASQRSLDGARQQLDEGRHAEAAARDALATARDRRATFTAEAAQRTQEAAGHRQAAQAFANGLGDIAEPALTDPQGTLATLRAHQRDMAGAPKRKAALDRAVSDHTAWSAQRTAKHDEIATIPDAHRIDEAAARQTAAAADAAGAAARDALQAAQHQLTMLEARIDERARMRADKERAETRLKLLRKLVKLLGKGGLQGALVTGALSAITSHANAFLQRLTGGSLQLTITKGDGDALELQAIDATCMREARSVKVLSGSQKFRCAVAIASGIGQYAGAGGMRSIVIDEGFGSLDQAGQQLMVEELKQLATHMDKVIVVSHLEAFTNRDNFPDQILVETDGSGSRIRKVF